MRPVAVAVEILDHVQRRAERLENRDLLLSLVQAAALVEGDQRVARVLQQTREEVIKVGVRFERPVHVVEVHEDRHLPHVQLPAVVAPGDEGLELLHGGVGRSPVVEGFEALSYDGVVQGREEIRAGEVAELHDVSGIGTEVELARARQATSAAPRAPRTNPRVAWG